MAITSIIISVIELVPLYLLLFLLVNLIGFISDVVKERFYFRSRDRDSYRALLTERLQKMREFITFDHGKYKNMDRADALKRKVFRYALAFATIAGIIINILRLSTYGDTTIGHQFEKKEYVENYYVNLFPEGSVSENYRVRAEIEAEEDFIDDGDDRGHTVRVYHINEAYFPDGKTITFYGDNEPLKVNKRVHIEDDDGREWQVELTTIMARSAK